MLFDTHSHCYWDTLAPQISKIRDEMKKYSVVYSTQIWCDLETSKKAIELAHRYPETFFATVGFHPTDCQDLDFDASEDLRWEFIHIIEKNSQRIVAIGECGFDFFHMSKDDQIRETQLENQKKWWKWQIELGKKYNLPLIIHTRDARDQTIKFIIENDLKKYILHCFSEDIDMVEELSKQSDDFMVSFSGIVTYKNAQKVQETAAKIPLEKILIETDSPFLAPQVVRGQENNPANVRFVFDKICELRDEDSQSIEDTIFENSCRVYGI